MSVTLKFSVVNTKSLGQSSIEFMMVVGIALAISAPFVIQAQRSVLNIQQGSDSVKLQTSLDKISAAVETVSTSGPPARRTFYVSIPEDVVSGKVIQDRFIVYTIERGGQRTNVTRSFDVNISEETGLGLPEDTSRAKITVYAWENQVNITEVP